ncbi:MAG TPA: NAD(P)-dependent oxidoreductase [Actinomycetota bacterium]|jgi:phosphoglycerate dehydrogenase-like enzyme|nr:NAD(P)-dependent oxidoreductase [Actinomycetota bacterium]
MRDREVLVLTPPQDGWQTVQGSRRYLHGGTRYRNLADEILSPHAEVVHLDWTPNRAPDGRLSEAQAIVLAPWLPWPGVLELPAFDEAGWQRTPNLRAIAGTFDYRLGWIDLEAAARRDAVVVDTSRTMRWTVAEFGVAITLSLLRDIPAAIDVVRRGGWPDAPMGEGVYVFRDLADCRVGLAGYGSINRRYRSFIEPYGCAVTIFDPIVGDDVARGDRVARAPSLVELARASDILVVAIPPTPSTLGVIDAAVIDALAPGSLFVLLSRMAVVEQDALWRRVQAGELRAAIDVFEPEPPAPDAWFRRDPHVLPTPHIAGNVRFAQERCFAEACADVVRVLDGEEPLHPATVRDKRLYDGTLSSAGAR